MGRPWTPDVIQKGHLAGAVLLAGERPGQGWEGRDSPPEGQWVPQALSLRSSPPLWG